MNVSFYILTVSNKNPNDLCFCNKQFHWKMSCLPCLICIFMKTRFVPSIDSHYV